MSHFIISFNIVSENGLKCGYSGWTSLGSLWYNPFKFKWMQRRRKVKGEDIQESRRQV
jgi:hypothetical protein